MMYCRNL